jgi:hypothetical protein
MMEVQKFLQTYGLEELQKQFAIGVTDYPDRVVLNYNQIDSPRFNPIVDECRALILRKGTWEVMARSFDRFYNLGEGCDPKDGLDMQRIPNPGIKRTPTPNDIFVKRFNIAKAVIQEKLDGSLMSFYWDGEKWCVSTRKLAFAEGQTNLGRTFAEVFWDAASKTQLPNKIKTSLGLDLREFTLVFELTGPENRVVTPYSENKITLIGGRSNSELSFYRELSMTELDNLADVLDVGRPKPYTVDSYEKLLILVDSFPTMDEGVVLLIEAENGSHWRIKCKNPKYVAVAHLRENGGLSPKNVLSLVMSGEHYEYLKYFPEDKKYFDFVEVIYAEVKQRIVAIYAECKDIKEQKDFALTMMPKTKFSFEKGIIFSMRKGGDMEQLLREFGAKKLSQGLNLKQKFIDEFHVVVEDDEKD